LSPSLLGDGRMMPVVLGLADGLMNALTLAGGSIIDSGSGIDLGLALRIAAFAVATAAFVIFVARYAEFRSGLVRGARQLNIPDHGRLAGTALGRAVAIDAGADALLASLASGLGALVPLAIAAAFPELSWLAVVVAIGLLATLGAALGRVVLGSPLVWAAGLALGGAILTAVGVALHIA
jgi:hypothetical protein